MGGPPPVLGSGQVGEISAGLLEILSGVTKQKHSKENVEADGVNVEMYVTELATVCEHVFHILGKLLEQEPNRIMTMVAATESLV